jgi:hypothetical protein
MNGWMDGWMEVQKVAGARTTNGVSCFLSPFFFGFLRREVVGDDG